MRVISGTAKGRQLAPFPGREIRPTTDFIREAIFSILFSHFGALAGKKVLDLFAGTGAMGIEALSRGAAEAVFIEKNRQAAALIQRNLNHCALNAASRILAEDAVKALPRLKGERFDLIFMDPPYGQGLLPPLLGLASDLEILSETGVVCAESGKKEDLPDVIGALTLFKKNRYGSTAVHFFRSFSGQD